MTEERMACYLYCEACNFQQDVEKVLPHTPLKSVQELRENVRRFHCSVCGAKRVTIREKPISYSK